MVGLMKRMNIKQILIRIALIYVLCIAITHCVLANNRVESQCTTEISIDSNVIDSMQLYNIDEQVPFTMNFKFKQSLYKNLHKQYHYEPLYVYNNRSYKTVLICTDILSLENKVSTGQVRIVIYTDGSKSLIVGNNF